jgi:hypothetical protein
MNSSFALLCTPIALAIMLQVGCAGSKTANIPAPPPTSENSIGIYDGYGKRIGHAKVTSPKPPVKVTPSRLAPTGTKLSKPLPPLSLYERMEKLKVVVDASRKKVEKALRETASATDAENGCESLVATLIEVAQNHGSRGNLHRYIADAEQSFTQEKSQAQAKVQATIGETKKVYLEAVTTIDAKLDELAALRSISEVTLRNSLELQSAVSERLEVYKDTRGVLGEEKAEDSLRAFLNEAVASWE